MIDEKEYNRRKKTLRYRTFIFIWKKSNSLHLWSARKAISILKDEK